MPSKAKKQERAQASKRLRKAKFQADIAPVSERKPGHHIVSESAMEDREILLFPRLERIAPDLLPPQVEIKWTERELESLAELASAAEVKPPTEALIRALRD